MLYPLNYGSGTCARIFAVCPHVRPPSAYVVCVLVSVAMTYEPKQLGSFISQTCRTPHRGVTTLTYAGGIARC
jgi:hypothetical protein